MNAELSEPVPLQQQESAESAVVRSELKRQAESASGTGGAKALRTTEEEDGEVEHNGLRVNPSSICTHDVAVPEGFGEVPPELYNPPFHDGPAAKAFNFQLDAFQATAITCLERSEHVLVSAHTSAGKTVVAEYAIAMCFRDKQRVVYTSPLKALSNQKFRELKEEFDDVGLMTGDITINPQATCVVMTTEILRSMLYRGDELLQSMKWVIFDEIHYMRDKERGVVWEESMIFCPPRARMVFLSATLPNASEFAHWVAYLHSSPCHMVYTDHRPVPLQHYVFPPGGKGMHMVVDEDGNFLEDNFAKVEQDVSQQANARAKGKTRGGGRGGGQGGRAGRGGGRGAGGSNSEESDVSKVVQGIKDEELEPAIVFAFSRRECEEHAMKCQKMEFNSDEEQRAVEEIFYKAIKSCLSEDDQQLRAVTAMLPLLKRGVGVHHSGLLPILKELVEILFQEHLIKALFATETFAMGLNMPARTVVFTAIQKWDGEKFRYLSSGEYVQMSGRAGRRGQDARGVCLLMADENFTSEDCKSIMQGEPMALESSFRLTFYSILNLFRRSEKRQSTEYVISRSFHQFQHERRLPELERQIEELEREAAEIQSVSESAVEGYNELNSRIAAAESEVQFHITQPDAALPFLNSGRLIRVKQKSVDWGWGILIAAMRRTPDEETEAMSDPRKYYQLDMLLPCARLKDEAGRLQPAAKNAEADMRVVPVLLSLVYSISSLRLSLPHDLRTSEQRHSVLLMLREVEDQYFMCPPTLHPRDDMKVNNDRFNRAFKELEELEPKLRHNVVHQAQDSEDAESNALFQHKANLRAKANELREQKRNSELNRFKSELSNRAKVLRRLGHLDECDVITTKGKATCQIDTADELVTSELMFNGAFNKLDKYQLAALCSCFVQVEKSREQVKMKDKPELAEPLRMLQESARQIAEVENECKIEVNEEDYVNGFKPTLMDVVYHWSHGANFDKVCDMTDVFEGSVVKAIRRLDEVLVQLAAAAESVGDAEMGSKCVQAAATLRHSIVASASLYL